MYLNFDVTQVPGGYIVQMLKWDEDAEDEYHETVVFTTLEGVGGCLTEYFTTDITADSGADDGGEAVPAASPVRPLLPGPEEEDV